MKWVLAFLAVCLVLGVVALGFFFLPGLFLRWATDGPEHSAGYYPPRTIVYGWLTLAPRGGQLEDFRDSWGLLNERPEFRDLVDGLEADLELRYGIDVGRDVAPWAGPEMSVGLLDHGPETGGAVVAGTVGVRDRGAASEFLEGWLERARDSGGSGGSGDSGGVSFRSGSYRGFDVWSGGAGGRSYALSGEVLVFGTAEAAVREVIDGVSGKAPGSLADTAAFREARSSLPGRRFASLFVNSREAEGLAAEMDGGVLLYMLASGVWEDSVPGWFALSAAVFDRALTVHVNAPAGVDGPLEALDLSVPGGMMPAGTPFFLAGSFDPSVDRWREAAEARGPLAPGLAGEINAAVAAVLPPGADAPPLLDGEADLGDVIGLALGLGLELTGLDWEGGFMDHLSGAAVFVLHGLDLGVMMSDPWSNPVDAVVLLPHLPERGVDLERTMREFSEFLDRDVNVPRHESGVGAAGGLVVHDTGTGYQPGYAVHGGHLVLGTTWSALARTVGLAEGWAEFSLASDEEYLRVRGHLPERSRFMMYLDMGGLLRGMDPGRVGMTGDRLEVLGAAAGRMMVSSYTPRCPDGPEDAPDGGPVCVSGGLSETVLALTFLEEPGPGP